MLAIHHTDAGKVFSTVGVFLQLQQLAGQQPAVQPRLRCQVSL